ncbi:extensin family protein [Yoonia sp. R2331]|uniref:extensin-like domain-containing protein n=1 Tax=Yoonia sp. R2331 TaxID=3237238 RepID=UPI0034E57248
MPAFRKITGRAIRRAVFLSVLVFGCILGAAAILHPETPLPDYWNPLRPLNVAAPLTPMTTWKLGRTTADPEACLAALGKVSQITSRASFATNNPNCAVTNPVTIRDVGAASLGTLETGCATALRLAMWERHSVQPAAREHLDTDVSEILDQGSYNCRAMRTSAGNSTRWSTHATADAIDVRGFRLSDGGQVILLRDWGAESAKSAFLREVQRGSCRWFKTTLGPDYNALHADHFHLQSRGWGTCR